MLAAALLALLGSAATLVEGTQVMSRPATYKESHPILRSEKRSVIEERAGTKVSIGYYPNWDIYGRNFQPSNIIPSTLTHILYCFADVGSTTGQVVLSDTYADQQKHYDGDSWSETGNNLYGVFKQLYLMKKAQRNLKVLLSIGGYTYSQEGHFNFISSPSARATFVSSAIQLLEDNGLDGIDIDFEYATSAQTADYASLITELRAGLDAHASSKGDTVPYQLSAAVPAGSQNYVNLDVATMDKALTFWNLMAYDYAGSWSNISDDQANLYRGNTKEGVDTDTTINWYTSKGATKSKITMGLPLYGRAFESTNGIQQPFNGIGSGSWDNGVWDLKVLPKAGATVVEESNGASYSYDSSAKELISYDTNNVAKTKANYIVSQGLAGSMYWELSSDYVGSGSMVSAVNSVLGALDQTQNHLLYPGSQFLNMQTCMGGCTSTGSGSTTTTTSTKASSTTTSTTTTKASTTSTTSTTTKAATTSTTTSKATTSTTSTTSKAATTTTSASSSGGCSGVAAWVATTAYVGGQTATYGGYLWTAKWWTEGDTPGGAAGVWTQGAKC